MSLVEEKLTFASFSNILDARILRALADLGFAHPTLIQAKAIPLALEGKDILARARTGSGKTAAYCIPIIKKIASSKLTLGSSYSVQKTRGLILVPTRELAEQVTSHLGLLLKYFENEIIVVNVASGGTSHLQNILLSDQPDIVVATPTKALAFLRSKNLSLAALESLVIDEADLILSYGHDEDVRQILGGSYLPKVFQSFLMSATMTKDVETLKGLILRNPAILRLEEDEDATAQLNQYSIHCSEVDKFLLAYVILKLRLVKGKCIFFVNGVERCYRLKLFLEQFSIKSCVLNSELPLNSRYHIVEEFNKGVYDYIIATDESAGRDEMDSDSDAEADAEAEGETVESAPEPNPEENHIASTNRKRKRSASPPRKKSKRVPKSDKEYGVSRGIDFVSVSCVLNFDLPSSSRAYIHRVGRTARAGKSGIAISFLVPEDEWGKDKVVGCVETTKKDEKVFARIVRKQKQKGHEIKEWAFDQKQVEAFRYRMEDALRSVTKRVIGEARVKEITSEMLNSDKLKAYFEDNPRTLNFLRHDKPLHPTRIQPHLKYVPKYLKQGTVPGEMTADGVDESQETAFIPFKKPSNHTRRGRGRGRGGKSNLGRRKKDPLKGVR